MLSTTLALAAEPFQLNCDSLGLETVSANAGSGSGAGGATRLAVAAAAAVKVTAVRFLVATNKTFP